jgi:hypothetical protein
MTPTRVAAYGVVLALFAVAPLLYVSATVFEPRRKAWVADVKAREDALASRRADLASRASALQNKIADASAQGERWQKTSTATAQQLRETMRLIEEGQPRLEALRRSQALLNAQVSELDSTLATNESRADEAERAHAVLASDVTGLQNKLHDLDDQLSFTSAETAKLVRERQAWEARETFRTTPRAAAEGAVGWYGDLLCGGVALDMWLLRPWGQRLGLKSAFLVDQQHQKPLGFAGLGWQELVSSNLNLDVWAGPHWSTLSTRASTTVDPALGVAVGTAVPKLHLGLGLMAMATPHDTLVGATVGYSQVGEKIDVYRHH